MHGIFGIYHSQLSFQFCSLPTCLVHHMVSLSTCRLWQYTLPKFENDKVFIHTDDFVFIIEGVILNSDELLAKYHQNSLSDVVPLLYQQLGETFFRIFRGSFCGVIYDIKQDVLIVYNDHIGDHMIFYTEVNGGICISPDLRILATALSGIKTLRYNERFIYSLLTYGFSPLCETIYNDIFRIPAGQYLRISNSSHQLLTFHRFVNKPNNLTEKDNIEYMDSLFQTAVQRVLHKNQQYGFSQYLPLSAGLDSRMVNCVAHQLYNQPMNNVTYSQSEYYDDVIPKQLANYWGNTMHFRALDGGDYLTNLDETVSMTQGLVQYSGASQVLDSFGQLSQADIGVVMTGMLGDIIFGTAFTEQNYHQHYKKTDGAYSQYHMNHMSSYIPKSFWYEYPNREIYYLYVRGFYCANLGSPLVLQSFGESYSPFYDVDVLEFALSIPLKWRWNYHIYDRWILHKYPDMAQWLHNGTQTIGHRNRQISLCGRKMEVRDVPQRMFWYILKQLHIHDYYQEQVGTSMNPEDTWFRENQKLQIFANEYISNNLSLLPPYTNLKNDVLDLAGKNATQKMLVLTLLSTLKHFPC